MFNEDDSSADEKSALQTNMIVDKRVLLNITDICNKIKLKNDGTDIVSKINQTPSFNYKNDIEELSFITHDSNKEEKNHVNNVINDNNLILNKVNDDFEVKSNASTKTHSSKTKEVFKFNNSIQDYHQSEKSKHYSEKKEYSDKEDNYYQSNNNPIDNIKDNRNGSVIVAKPKSYIELKQQLEYKINLFTQWERLYNVYGGTHTQQLNFETTTIEEIEFELIKLKTKRSQGNFAATAKKIISMAAFGIETGAKSLNITNLNGWSGNINHNLDQFDDAIDDLNIMFAGSGKNIHPLFRISGLMLLSAITFALSQTVVSNFTNQMFNAVNNNGTANTREVNVGGFKDFGPPDLDDELNELLMNKQDMRDK